MLIRLRLLKFLFFQLEKKKKLFKLHLISKIIINMSLG